MEERRIVELKWLGDDLIITDDEGKSTRYFNCYPVSCPETSNSDDPKVLTVTFTFGYGISGYG